MPTLRFPILISQDCSGQFSATLIEQSLTAVGGSRREAVDQLRDCLEFSTEPDDWAPRPNFRDPRLDVVRVPVRPEYVRRDGENRVYPCHALVPLRVHCVHARQPGRLFLASIPLMDVRFYYHEEDSLQDLVVRYVQFAANQHSPGMIARYLPPQEVWLDSLSIHWKKKATRQTPAPQLPTLTSIAEPLGDRNVRRQYGHAWERDAEVLQVVERFRHGQGNVLLVGDTGIGKTTVLAEAVRILEREGLPVRDVDEELQSARNRRLFWLTNSARLISGMKYLGQWQQRCELVIFELGQFGGVLCIESLLDLVRTGGQDAGSSVGAFLQMGLQHGQLRMIAEATPQELEACRRLLPGLVDLFQIVKILPLERRAALSLLEQGAKSLEQSRRVQFSPGVLEHIYRLHQRFTPYQAFPGKALPFLTDLADAARKTGEAISTEDVVRLFIRRTGLPEIFLRDDVSLEFDDVRGDFERQIIGQPSACRAAANLVTTFKAGMNDPQRPIGVLLFCGPTGVGKTELARQISTWFFGHGEATDRLVRLDMSEYAGHDAAERLLGEPDGEPSELIRKIRAQPFAVVLLDEIEKAAPDVFDMLLTLFDEGRLTDRYGRTTNFRSTIVILTSNLGSDRRGSIGFSSQIEDRFDADVQSHFRPEFYNRLDGVVTFSPLLHETILSITRKELLALHDREGFRQRRLKLACSDRLVEALAHEGCDPRYGARPLQRTIERRLVTPLARFLLAHDTAIDATIHADLNDQNEPAFHLE